MQQRQLGMGLANCRITDLRDSAIPGTVPGLVRFSNLVDREANRQLVFVKK